MMLCNFRTTRFCYECINCNGLVAICILELSYVQHTVNMMLTRGREGLLFNDDRKVRIGRGLQFTPLFGIICSNIDEST